MRNDRNQLVASSLDGFFPDGLEKSMRLSKHDAKRWGIGLKIIDFSSPQGELPQEVIIKDYSIGVNLGQHHRMTQVIDGKNLEYPVPEGAVGILPYQLPTWSRWDRDVKHLFVHIDSELMSRCALELFGEDRFEIPAIPNTNDSLIKQIVFSVRRAISLDHKGSQIYNQTMVDALVMHLLQNYSNQTNPIESYAGGLPYHTLNRVKDFIENNLSRELSLDELAEIAQLSRFHFSRAFKKSVNSTPHQYIITRRVERVKILLKQGKESIADIATICGFCHQSHLTRHFKRLTGLTPKKFSK